MRNFVRPFSTPAQPILLKHHAPSSTAPPPPTAGPVLELHEVLKEHLDQTPLPVFWKILKIYTTKGQPKNLVEFLALVTNKSQPLPPTFFSTAIDSFIKLNHTKEAIKLFESMPTVYQCQPDPKLYNNILQLYSNLNNTTEAKAIFQKIPEKVPQHFDTLISMLFGPEKEEAILCFCDYVQFLKGLPMIEPEAQRLNRVLARFDRLSSGALHDLELKYFVKFFHSLYDILQHFTRPVQSQLIVQLAWKWHVVLMSKLTKRPSDPRPEQTYFQYVFHILSYSQENKAAVHLVRNAFSDMISLNISPEQQTFIAFIEALVALQDYEGAKKVLESLGKKVFPSTERTHQLQTVINQRLEAVSQEEQKMNEVREWLLSNKLK